MKGYTIIEVLISTAIASFLSVALFVALRQTMAFQVVVDTNVDAYTRVAVFQDQFEKDFMGFFVPFQAYELVKSNTAQTKPAKEKAEQIDNIFYATSNKKQFDMLSYITTHAMQVYWGVTMGAPKPFVTRVVYRLVKDSTVRPESIEGQEKVESFTLQRQESRDLDFASGETGQGKAKIRSYDILTNIKSMQITYLARVYKEEEKDVSKDSSQSNKGSKQTNGDDAQKPKDKKSKKGQTWKYREFTEWNWSPKQAKSEKKNQDEPLNRLGANGGKKEKEKVSRIPFYMKVDLILWNAEHTREIPFSFVFARKPFEMVELEKDKLETKKEAQLPSFKPIFDILKLPSSPTQKKVEAPAKRKQDMVMAPPMGMQVSRNPENTLHSFASSRMKKS